MIDVKKSDIKNEKDINLGIQILRMLLCFWVLCFHCLDSGKINYFIFYITKTKFFHVPCFVFISFYFSSNIFIERNYAKVKVRLERLLIPYIIWPLIIFITHNIIYSTKISFNILKFQLLLGRQYLFPLYYLFSMFFITIFLFVISVIFKSYFLYILLIMMLLSYIGQYDQYIIFNHELFLNKYQHYIRMPIIDTISFVPLSCLGIIFASSKIIIFLESNSKTSSFLSCVIIYFLFKYDVFVNFRGYNGFKYFFSSTSLFVAFYLLPLEKIYPLLKKLIKLITKYTNGIYCIHVKMKDLVNIYIYNIGDFKCSIIIYLLCYFISFIGIKLFGKTRLKYLFI